MKEQKVKGLKLGSANTHKVQVDPINWLDSSWSMLQMVKSTVFAFTILWLKIQKSDKIVTSYTP